MHIHSRLTIAALVIFLGGCKKELLEGLDQRQANEVMAALQRSNIDAEKRPNGKKGFFVLVEQEDMATAVDLLKVNELPSAPRTQIADMFPKDTLVTSPRGEKARLYSAIEQRLEQSLATLNGVSSARVHVSYDVESDGGKAPPAPVHISALITYHKELDEQQLINVAKRFLRNSFTRVEYDNISVVTSKRASLQQVSSGEKADENGHWRTSAIVLGTLFILAVGTVLWLLRRRKPAAPIREVADMDKVHESSHAL